MFVKRLKKSKFYQKHKYRLERANDLLSLFSAICLILFIAGDQSNMALKRHALANEIKITAIITGLHTGIYDIDDKVIRAMARVPRHHYVNQPYMGFAYYNVALPVDGQDYMIPEPFVTAMMVHLMDIQPTDNILEIGFGRGYDAAVIGQLAGNVHSVIQIDPLQKIENTDSFLNEDYSNIITRESDATLGWPEAGPYDSILVRQSMAEPPLALLRQLKADGKLIIPIGASNETQRLMVYTRTPGGKIIKRPTLHLKIAPLLKGSEI